MYESYEFVNKNEKIIFRIGAVLQFIRLKFLKKLYYIQIQINNNLDVSEEFMVQKKDAEDVISKIEEVRNLFCVFLNHLFKGLNFLLISC